MQKEYLPKTTSVVDRDPCNTKRDKTDIECQLNELNNHSEQIEKLVIGLYERLTPVMSFDCNMKESKDMCNEKMDNVSPLASHIRVTNISLNNSILKMDEIFRRLQI